MWWDEFAGELPGHYVHLRTLLRALQERVEFERDEEVRDWIGMKASVLDSVLRRFELFDTAATWDEMSPQEQEEVRVGNPSFRLATSRQTDEAMVERASQLLDEEPEVYAVRRGRP